MWRRRSYITRNLRFFSSTKTENTSNLVGIGIFTSICATAAGLGYWQLQRYDWKVNLIEELKRREQDEPLQITDLETLENTPPGRRITLTGQFQHSKEVLIGPRSAPVGVYRPAQGMASNPQGYYVVTPFVINGSQQRLFINRGWVHRNSKTWERPEGEVSVCAISGSLEKESTFTPKNDVRSKQLLWIEGKALIEASESVDWSGPILIADIYEKQNNPARTATLPIPKTGNVALDMFVQPETHLAYAFTWFSLSVAGSYMTYLRFKKRKKL